MIVAVEYTHIPTGVRVTVADGKDLGDQFEPVTKRSKKPVEKK